MPLAATLLAFVTIALWSFLALLGARLNHLPSIQVVGVALTLSGLVSLVQVRQWRIPLKTLAVGVGGIFGYHFLYFSAYHYAPVVEANLINYLWPLLIVLLTPLYLPGQRLRPYHWLGAITGLAGAGLIVTGGRFSLDLAHLRGYLLAAGAAFIWASYSLLTKRLPHFPTAAVGSFCLVSGLLSLGATLLDPAEAYVPPTPQDWISLVLLGLGPLGAAFFAWDAALKHGDPRIIGSLAYLTPLTSTLILVLVGGGAFTWVSGLAMALIVAGAVIGSWDLFRRGERSPATDLQYPPSR
ncbi:MAG: EamA/RhaT family transporter [Chloroflexota bacterium]|nr:MAG: EamA/RhaT family transporter [Chloroflexota bacterium]